MPYNPPAWIFGEPISKQEREINEELKKGRILKADNWYSESLKRDSFTPEQKEKLDNRRDIYDVIQYIAPIAVNYKWLIGWAKGVATLDDEEVKKLRRALPWIHRVSREPSIVQAINRSPSAPLSELITYALQVADISHFQGAFAVAGVHIEIPSLGSDSPLPSAFEFGVKTANLAQSIAKDYEEIQRMWQESNDTVRVKWMRMSEERRVEILTRCGVTNQRHAAHFVSLIHNGAPRLEDGNPSFEFGQIAGQLLNEDTWKVPHINIEDLKNEDLLLTFLESRATATPELFIWTDKRPIELANHFDMSGIVPAYLFQHYLNFGPEVDGYGMVFSYLGALRKAATHSGRQVDELQTADEKEVAKYWFGITANIGLAAMEVQAYTYNFLKKVLLGILDAQNEEPQNLATAESTILTEPTSSEEYVGGTVDPVIKVFKERHYSKPGEADIENLMKLIATIKRNQRDEILMLRENPGFFADSFRQMRDHSADYITHETGKKSAIQATTKSKRVDEFNADNMHSMIYDSFKKLLILSDLELEFGMVHRLFEFEKDRERFEKFKGRIGDETPKVFVQACAKLLMKLKTVIEGEINDFISFFVGSPNFRGRFLRCDFPGIGPEVVKLNTTKSRKVEEYGDLVRFIGSFLDPTQPYMGGVLNKDPVLLVDELDRLVQAESAKKDTVSSFLHKRISIAVVYAACLAQLQQYQPMGGAIEMELHTWSGDKCNEYTLIGQQKILKVKKKIEEVPVKEFVGPFLEGNYVRLFDNPPSKKNTPKRRKAEDVLGQLWKVIDQHLEELKGKELPDCIREILREPASTTPWKTEGKETEGKEAELDRPEVQKVAERQPAQKVTEEQSAELDIPEAQKVAEEQPDNEPALERPEFKLKPVSYGTKRLTDDAKLDEDETSAPEQPSQKRIKIKVRNPPDPVKAAQEAEAQARARERESAAAAAEQNLAGIQVPAEFEVDQRDLRTFQQLFFQEGCASHSGDWAWTDICRALTRLGFAMAPMGGSMVRFSPPAQWRADDITFHSPHPQRNLSFRLCRNIGRRLTRNYGIGSNHFVLRNT